MGTPGLHPKLIQAKKYGHLEDFVGKVALVDTLIWICQNLYGSKLQNGGAGAIQSCVADVLKKINLLLKHGIKPIMVFDGRKLPGKAKAHKERKEKRDKLRKAIEEKKKMGKIDDTDVLKDLLMEVDDNVQCSSTNRPQNSQLDVSMDLNDNAQSSSPSQTPNQPSKLTDEEVLVLLLDALQIDEQIEEARNSAQVGSDIIHELIVVLREAGIDYIVAPYEADSQIAFLAREGYGDIVLSEDGDLVTHGCQEILFKMQRNGSVKEIYQRSQLKYCPAFPEGYDQKRMIWRAILGECDYLQSLPGIKIGKALKIVNQTPSTFSSTEMLRSIPQFLNKPDMLIPDEYFEDFYLAEFTFRHPIVFDPLLKHLVPLNPYPPHSQPSENCRIAAGPLFSNQEAYDLAVGNISPAQPNYTRYAKFDFEASTTYPENALWRSGFKKQLRVQQSHMATNESSLYLQRKVPKCTSCGLVFSYTSQLLRHSRVHCGGRKYKCPLCPRQYKQCNSYKNHLRMHTGTKPFKCPLCPRRFSNMEYQKKHIKKCPTQKRAACKVCGQRCSEDTLQLHNILKHQSTQLQLTCPKCPFVTVDVCKMMNHLHFHNEIKKFVCSICGFRSNNRSKLKMHEKIHQGSNLFNCEVCGIPFKTNYAKQKHINQKHAESKLAGKYKCSICSMTFSHSYALKLHKYSSHSQRNIANAFSHFNCLYCERKFTTVGLRNIHATIHHPEHVFKGQEPYIKCDFCEDMFNNKYAYRTHVLASHFHERIEDGNIVVTCEWCKKLITKHNYKKHCRAVHPSEFKKTNFFHMERLDYIKCQHCEQMFQNQNLLTKHVVDHHLSEHLSAKYPYKCGKCEERFSSSFFCDIHETTGHGLWFKIQDKVNQFQCSLCGTFYSQQKKLTAHIKKYHSIQSGQNNCEDGRIKCKYCDERFIYSYLCKIHEETGHGVWSKNGNRTTFLCKYCGLVFCKRAGLSIHLKKKHRLEVGAGDQSNFKCRWCDLSYKTKNHCRTHEQSKHTMEYKEVQTPLTHQCRWCPKSFDKKSSVNGHEVKMHRDEYFKSKTTTISCQWCQLKFGTYSGRNVHLKKFHPDKVKLIIKNFQCNWCESKFSNSRTCRQHARAHHRAEYFAEGGCDIAVVIIS